MTDCVVCTHPQKEHSQESAISEGIRTVWFVCDVCKMNCSEKAGNAGIREVNPIDLAMALEPVQVNMAPIEQNGERFLALQFKAIPFDGVDTDPVEERPMIFGEAQAAIFLQSFMEYAAAAF